MTTCPLFDSHAHFASDYAEVIDRAAAAGMSGLAAVGGCAELNGYAEKAALHAPGFVRLALGFDRTAAETVSPETAVELLAADAARCSANGTPIAAVGELGLDYFYDGEGASRQKALFSAQVSYAAEKDYPIIVHSRDADADTLAVLKECGSPARVSNGTLGVLHCFTGGADFAEKVMAAGMFVSFSGILTFRNADSLRETAKTIPDDRLLIETDCPYLTPVPLRGIPNEPAFVKHTAECLASVRGVTVGRIAEVTSANARRLFGGVR